MDNEKNLFQELLKADDIDPVGATDSERLAFQEMLDQQSKSKHSKPAIAQPDILRIIMKNRISKFAAAAVIILAVLIGINQFGGSIDGTSVAWAKVTNAMKQVENMHMVSWVTTIDGEKTKEDEYWFKKPYLVREESGSRISIDNGLEKLEIHKRYKTAQFIESEQDSYSKADFMLYFAGMLRGARHPDYKVIPEIIQSESTEETFVYDVLIAYDSPKVRVWVDAHTLLVTRAVWNDTDQAGDKKTHEMLFSFDAIPDEMFELKTPEGYTQLPRKSRPVLSGWVIDQKGKPVSGANIWVSGPVSIHGMHSVTNDDGQFELKGTTVFGSKMRFPIFIRAYKKDTPDEVAWTVLSDPGIDKELPGAIPPCENVQFDIDENTTGPDKCRSASNIILKMIPANKISGTVKDSEGNPIEGAKVQTRHVWFTRWKDGTYIMFNHPLNLEGKHNPSAITDSHGRYKLSGLPQLDLKLNVQARDFARAESSVKSIDEFTKEIDFTVKPAGITIRGIVTNSVGKPLPYYTIKHTLNGKPAGTVYAVFKDGGKSNGTHVATDKDGTFTLINCPAEQGLAVTASGALKLPNRDSQLKYWKVEDEFAYYGEKTVDIGYHAGKKEYYVEIVLDDPETYIEIEVTGTDGKGLEGMQVKLETAHVYSPLFESQTDENGRCIFRSFPWVKSPLLTIKPPSTEQIESTNKKKRNRQSEPEFIYPQLHWKTITLTENIKDYRVKVTTQEHGRTQVEVQAIKRE